MPEPTARPGQLTDFAYLRVSAAGEVPRPAVDIKAAHTGTMAWKLIRVLDDQGRRHVFVALIQHPNAQAARPALDALVDWSMRAAPAAAGGE